jgi:D-tyrosyl-tRNA(Tyr) deacylase
VAVGGQVVGGIDEPGLLVLVGITHTDTPELAARLAAKLWGLRILDGEKSCSDIGAPLLVISQFTLYAELTRGRRPSWSAAAPGPVAEPLVAAVVAALRQAGARVQTGIFGADMKVSLVNDGPVTIVIDLLRRRSRRFRAGAEPGLHALRPGVQGYRVGRAERRLAERLGSRAAVMEGLAAHGAGHGDVHAAVRRGGIAVRPERSPDGQAGGQQDHEHADNQESPFLAPGDAGRAQVGLGVHDCTVYELTRS